MIPNLFLCPRQYYFANILGLPYKIKYPKIKRRFLFQEAVRLMILGGFPSTYGQHHDWLKVYYTHFHEHYKTIPPLYKGHVNNYNIQFILYGDADQYNIYAVCFGQKKPNLYGTCLIQDNVKLISNLLEENNVDIKHLVNYTVTWLHSSTYKKPSVQKGKYIYTPMAARHLASNAKKWDFLHKQEQKELTGLLAIEGKILKTFIEDYRLSRTTLKKLTKFLAGVDSFREIPQVVSNGSCRHCEYLHICKNADNIKWYLETYI